MATPPPPPPPPAAPPPAAPGGDGRTLRIVIIVVVVVVVLGAGLAAAIIFGIFQFFGGAAGLTSHIDRANEYLDAARSSPAVAEEMLCDQDAIDPATVATLATSTGQDLVAFSISNGSGTVNGSLELADGTTADVRVLTSGPVLPSDVGASEVCVVDVRVSNTR